VTEFIDIGFPRTASTTLQEHMFTKPPAIENVDRPFDNLGDTQLLDGLAPDEAETSAKRGWWPASQPSMNAANQL